MTEKPSLRLARRKEQLLSAFSASQQAPLTRQRRGMTDIIAQILEDAKHGKTNSKIIQRNSFSFDQFRNYVDMLVKCGLLEIKKADNFFITKDGRKYNLLYVTTNKGLKFIRAYKKLIILDSHKSDRVATLNS